MTLTEFKAWFEGYTEGLPGAPNEKQFKRIKDKVKEITGSPTTYPIYVERYRPYVTWGGGFVSNTTAGDYANHSKSLSMTADDFQPEAAMYAAGRAEAALELPGGSGA